MSTALENETSQDLEIPKMYSIMFYNDDFTPVNFVSHILSKIVNVPAEQAESLTNQIHVQGKGTAGNFTKDVAETKVAIISNIAIEAKFPLKTEAVEI